MRESSFLEDIKPALVMAEDYQRNPSDEMYCRIVEMCESISSRYPEEAEPHNILGIAHYPRDIKLAENNYRKAVELEPDNPAYLSNLASLLHQKGKINDAEEAYVKLLELGPDDKDFIHAQLGNIHFNKGKYEEALEHFDMAIDSGQRNTYVLGFRGMIRGSLGRLNEAMQDFREVLRDPLLDDISRATAWINLSNLYMAVGHISYAEEAGSNALDFCPEMLPDLLINNAMNQPDLLNRSMSKSKPIRSSMNKPNLIN